MPSPFKNALGPLIRLIDRSEKAPCERPNDWEETTRFPEIPWDLRTVIAVFDKNSPFRFLNLNTTLGLTGVPFDQAKNFPGDPKDAFDLQFCLEARDKHAAYKKYHSVSKELSYRTGEVYLKLDGRLDYRGKWPRYEIDYNQPEEDLELKIVLGSQPDFLWWAHFPGMYWHYTTFCDCRMEWKWAGREGVVETPVLHDHGWGKNLLPLRIPMRIFRYEVLRMPDDAYALSLWSEGPAGMGLKNFGLLRWASGERLLMRRYDCSVLEWDVYPNYSGTPRRVPRRWNGTQRGGEAQFFYEAVRATEPRAILGEGFLYAFDYRGTLKVKGHESVIEGEGYVEEFGKTA